MEVKINREIRNYTESMFFGLSMRQFIFSILACGVAVGLYFLLRPYFGVETLSWVCILGASPFAMLGFITYHGMTAEQFIWAWLRSRYRTPEGAGCDPRPPYLAGRHFFDRKQVLQNLSVQRHQLSGGKPRG